MPKQSDAVTTDYIDAQRMGITIRTPIENIAFFKAENKAVVAYTKSNGQFMLQTPLWVIKEILKGKFIQVQRSYLVQRKLMPGRSHWRVGEVWQFEIITSVSHNGNHGLLPHQIPISRRLTSKIKAILRQKPTEYKS